MKAIKRLSQIEEFQLLNYLTAISDEDVLKFATIEKRIVVTFNRKHFIRLHQKESCHEGIVVCIFDHDFAELADRIHNALELNKNISSQLIRINRPLKSE